MKCRYAVVLLSLLGSCSSEEIKPNPKSGSMAPYVTPTGPVIEPATAPVMAIPSIASVQMSQDCPDPKPASRAIKSAGERSAGVSAKDSRRGAFTQPCTQSTVQIAFMGEGAAGATVKIGAVRFKSAEGKELDTLSARGPSLWTEEGYKPWDGVLAPGSDHKASYKLSIPDWTALETALGRSSYGQMYVLELEVDIGGVVSIITSPQFERAQVLMIQT